MLFTPDERKALLVIGALLLLGLSVRLFGPDPESGTGPGDSLLVVLAARADSVGFQPAPPGLLDEGLLRINAATADELATLPGIGPVLGGRIVAERTAGGPFTGPADLERVSGIGPVRASRLAPLLSFRPPRGGAEGDSTECVQNATREAAVSGAPPGALLEAGRGAEARRRGARPGRSPPSGP
ncbi:MAG: hypothetical protein GF346_13250 [Candidatus Eisenbacteria bacterium]|nr:hypothetical protein [Candidatus Latescibacterota bacterium]MBD3303406.1 hypothetical protein [Candidatus Eisenbacteria bacterium]